MRLPPRGPDSLRAGQRAGAPFRMRRRAGSTPARSINRFVRAEGRPAGWSAARHAARGGFDSRPVHHISRARQWVKREQACIARRLDSCQRVHQFDTITGRPAVWSPVLHAELRGFDSRPVHHGARRHSSTAEFPHGKRAIRVRLSVAAHSQEDSYGGSSIG